jgi:hypothetical protein
VTSSQIPGSDETIATTVFSLNEDGELMLTCDSDDDTRFASGAKSSNLGEDDILDMELLASPSPQQQPAMHGSLTKEELTSDNFETDILDLEILSQTDSEGQREQIFERSRSSMDIIGDDFDKSLSEDEVISSPYSAYPLSPITEDLSSASQNSYTTTYDAQTLSRAGTHHPMDESYPILLTDDDEVPSSPYSAYPLSPLTSPEEAAASYCEQENTWRQDPYRYSSLSPILDEDDDDCRDESSRSPYLSSRLSSPTCLGSDPPVWFDKEERLSMT